LTEGLVACYGTDMSVPNKGSGTKRKRLPAPVRREQVLEVAAEVFARKGYRSAAVTDIVEGAGIGRGTFYLHFDSKKDVFLDLVEGYFSDFAQILKDNHKRLEEAILNRESVLQVWSENLRRLLEYHRDNPDLTSVIYREALGRDEDFSGRVDQLSGLARKQFVEEFDMLERHGLTRRADPDLVANIIMGSSVYVIMEHVVKGRGRNLEELADEMMEYHIRALMPRRSDAKRTMKEVVSVEGGGKGRKGG